LNHKIKIYADNSDKPIPGSLVRMPSTPQPRQQRPPKPEGFSKRTRKGKGSIHRYEDKKRSTRGQSTISSSSGSSKPVGQQHSGPSGSSLSKGKDREELQPTTAGPVVVSSDYLHRAPESEGKRPAVTGPVMVSSDYLGRASKTGGLRPATTGPVIVDSGSLHRAPDSEEKRLPKPGPVVVDGTSTRASESAGKAPASTGPVVVNGTYPYRASDPASRSEPKMPAQTGPVIVDGTSSRASRSEGKREKR
jgi:hypothetical protein